LRGHGYEDAFGATRKRQSRNDDGALTKQTLQLAIANDAQLTTPVPGDLDFTHVHEMGFRESRVDRDAIEAHGPVRDRQRRQAVSRLSTMNADLLAAVSEEHAIV